MSDIGLAVGNGLVIFAVLTLCAEIGFRSGRRQAKTGPVTGAGQVGAIQGALLGLLGLLLGFSFAAAGARFMERQDLIVQEANAIGTAYLRADLLRPDLGDALRASLRDYVKARVTLSERLRDGLSADDLAEIDRQHARIWKAAVAEAAVRPELAVSVLPPVNELIDLHSTRIAAGRKHLPSVIMGLLIACSMMALGVIGYGGGLAGSRRMLLTLALAFVVAAALWITIDLDYPRVGLLRLSDAPLKALRLGP